MKRTTYKNLTPTQRKLVDAAAEAMELAYCPYSRFYVGAALLTSDGKIITGSNVENASWSTVCAERSALSRANAMGHRTFKSMALITRGDDYEVDTPTAPCGSCRQSLFESAQLGQKDIPIILCSTDKQKIILTSIVRLLPMGFGPSDMGVEIKKFRRA